MSANYSTLQGPGATPYGSGDPYYTASTGYITPQPAPKKGLSKWIKIGVPLLVLATIAAVIGGVLGSRAKKSVGTNSSNGSSTGSSTGEAAASSVASVKLEIGRFATATDSEFMMPIYPSTVSSLHGSPNHTHTHLRPSYSPSHSIDQCGCIRRTYLRNSIIPFLARRRLQTFQSYCHLGPA